MTCGIYSTFELQQQLNNYVFMEMCVCVCVTLTKIFRTSGSDILVFPNFWMLNAAIFMLAVKKRGGGGEPSEGVCLNMPPHVRYSTIKDLNYYTLV